MKDKKLMKNSKNKKVSGVLSGIADYFGVDPTLVRLVYGIATIFFFPMVGIYFIADWCMPEDTEINKAETDPKTEKTLQL